MLTKNKRKKTINTAFISSHVCLKNSVSDFWNVRPFYFYKQIYSGMRNYCHHQWKIGYNFEMKRRIKICRDGFVGKLTLIWPNFSQIGPGAADLQFKIHAQLEQIFILRNKEK